MGVPNFSQGNIYMLGAYVAFFLAPLFANNYWLIFLATVIIMMVMGLVIERLFFRPVRDAPHINSFVVALGILMLIEGLVIVSFGADYKKVSPPWKDIVEFHGVTITVQRLLVILGSILIIFSLHYFLRRTKLGMCLEGMSQNRDLALMLGINVNRMSLLSFMMSTGLAGAGAALMAPVSFVYPEMGMTPLLIAFAAIIFGGLGSLSGAVIGSFIMALAHVFSTQYISAAASDIAIFGIMIVILLFRPRGIMGGRA
jgi:branched-chain amino acid transport system permease protein